MKTSFDDKNPWEFGHSTERAINQGRPITADEAKPLLDEIRRLRAIESAAAHYLRTEVAWHEARERLHEALHPEATT